jgi:UPF0176 protein
MEEQYPFLILAYYHLDPLENPREEIERHLDFFKERDASARVYMSEQGINGQLCAARQDAKDYMNWMHSRPEFKAIHFKIHPYHEHVFPRLTIKYRRHLVAYDDEIDFQNRGEYATPQEWKKMLEKQESLLLDIRNDYEWELGRFEGAELPPCKTFRDFEKYADELKEKTDPKKQPVMMYCTGGIRCELFSSILKKRGFEKVYQLQGGIINYGLNEGSKHWLGKLFVFDDRLSVPLNDEQTPVVGTCHFCKKESEAYYNCANMDCNHLFLCCPECLKQHDGCCKTECKNAPRLRPYHHQNPHKPFRRWHHYFATKQPK